jgi:putative endonuclease
MIQFLLRLSDAARDRARRRLWTPKMASGRRAEDLAHRYLRGLGLRVVARNFRPRGGAGEIDLVCWERDTLVFVEVKSRASEEFGSPDRAIDQAKRDALVSSARDYARRVDVPWNRIRFDVVNVTFSRPPNISHIKAAFPAGQAAYNTRLDSFVPGRTFPIA